MKKLFSFGWLSALFFKPRRRRLASGFGPLERLQLRTVPTAVGAAIAGDALDVTGEDAGDTEEVTDEGGEVVDCPEIAEEFVGIESVDGEIPEEWMYWSMPADFVDGEVPMMMAFTATGEEGEFVESDLFVDGEQPVYMDGEIPMMAFTATGEEGEFVEFVESEEGEVPPEFAYFSIPMDGEEVFVDGEEPVYKDGEVSEEFIAFSGEFVDGEVVEGEVVEGEVVEGEVVEDGEVVIDDSGEVVEKDDSGSNEVTPREIKPYYRTLGAATGGEVEAEQADDTGIVEEDVTTLDAESEGGEKVADEEVIGDLENPEIFQTFGGGGFEGGEGEGEPIFLPSQAGGGEEIVALNDGETPLEVTTTSDGEDNPEIRTLGGAGGEVTTLAGVLELGITEITAASESLQLDLTSHVGNFTQLVGLINAGFQQNAQDIAAFAAAGDTAGIQNEIAQNQALAAQLGQLVTAYVSGITSLHQNFISRLTIANTAISQAAANPAEISSAAAAFNQTRLAQPAFQSELAGKFTELQAFLDSQNGTDDTNGFAPDEPNPNGDEMAARIRQGNTSVTVSALNQSVTLTGDIANTSRPAVGTTTSIAINLWSTDDTLGDDLIYVSSVSGSVDLQGTDDGAAFVGGSLTIAGVMNDEPFSYDVDVPSDNGAVPSFDDNGILVGITGEFVTPEITGLIPAGTTITLNVTISPTTDLSELSPEEGT